MTECKHEWEAFIYTKEPSQMRCKLCGIFEPLRIESYNNGAEDFDDRIRRIVREEIARFGLVKRCPHDTVRASLQGYSECCDCGEVLS